MARLNRLHVYPGSTKCTTVFRHVNVINSFVSVLKKGEVKFERGERSLLKKGEIKFERNHA